LTSPRVRAPHFMIGVVPGVFDAFGKRARRGLIALSRRRLPERLVRAEFIVTLAEVVETGLLLLGVGRRRLRRLFFSVRCMRSWRPFS